MKQYINLKKISENLYEVYFENKSYLGQFSLDVDGDFYYWPSNKRGCWSAWSLKLIAEKLDELNRGSIFPDDIDKSNSDDNDHTDVWEHGTFI